MAPVREVDGIRDNEVSGVDYKRQLGMFDPALYAQHTIVIAGLGNIGSHTALALARMGLRKFELYDFDTVEVHNLSSQAYDYNDVGRLKTEATADKMRALNPHAQITVHNERYTGQTVGRIVVSAVDSIEIRKEICAGLPAGVHVVDGRMGGGQIEVHTQRSEKWGDTLQVVADDDPCGARYISYTSYLIAGLIANNVKRILRNEPVKATILAHADTLQLITQ